MLRIDPQRVLRAAQLVFVLTLVFTFAAAVMPAHAAPHLFSWDKAEHFVAFYALTGLAAAAFPRHNLLAIAALLSAFGAGIELVQALPFVNRDCDVRDWIADTLAIGAAVAPLALTRWRAWINAAAGEAATSWQR